ncbi:polyamine-transporting ATPase 13A3-like isoform X2 [Halichondria panicea]|uniref:polyamine-transporting ATPase 13A3-like isoform X2 n=1 Tax=Halichondria panicea TaxID=6063 RepID=UPI00312B544D
MEGNCVNGDVSELPNDTNSVHKHPNYGSNGESPSGINGHSEKASNEAVEKDDTSAEEEAPNCPPQTGYRISIVKSLFLYPLAVLPLGFGLLLAYWFPHVWLRLTSWTTRLNKATYVIVKDTDEKKRVERVHTVQLPPDFHDNPELNPLAVNEADQTVLLVTEKKSIRYFTHRHLRYLYDAEADRFILLRGFDRGFSCSEIHDMHTGLSTRTHQERLLYQGPNSIDVPVKPYFVLLLEEVLHPFYIFELLATIFWCFTQYYYYAGAVFLISVISVVVSLIQTRRNLQQLHDLIAQSCTVTVLRGGKEVEGVASEDLVPGDVLVIPPTGFVLPCDAALISGQAIVNEAMLTGESVPVTKTPLQRDHTHYDPTLHKRHTLFNGTQVIQTRLYGNKKVTAVVVRTGFSTSKGGMVRSILFPKPVNLKFYSDSIKFIIVMAIIGAAGFVYTIIICQVHHYQISETMLRAIDIITTAVPPALPAALTVGTVYALNRLKKHKIFCISPQRVNMCGKIKLVCFDKTGTLTEDSLDMAGVRPAHHGMFSCLIEDPCTLTPGPLLHAMATCHSLSMIRGQLSGDPIDLRMFGAIGWVLEEPEESGTTISPTVVHPLTTPTGDTTVELGIMKQFTFSSELQRMSVLVRSLPSTTPSRFQAYVKGAPETIKKLCKPNSIPNNFYEVLGSLTQQGFRVLAVAHKTINMPWHKVDKVKRDKVESELYFVGLIVLQNKLKAVTTPTILSLKNADIRTVMITGDNILTAVSVAKECQMVPSGSRVVMVKASSSVCGPPTLSYHLLEDQSDLLHLLESNNEFEPTISDKPNPLSFDSTHCLAYHLAVDGKTFALIKEHFTDSVYQRLLVKGTVFARMSPTQKAELVNSLMEIGYGVCMCGDGANDCRALKAAHAGISLSETEASVASPFTSKIPDITCVPKLIREGRAALVTSFSVFKYMALYSFAEFISAAILYAYESNLGDQQYLYIDLILALCVSFTMGFTASYPQLVKKRPLGTLAGIHVLLSIVIQTILLIVFQVGALCYLSTRSWYVPLIPDPESDNINSQENSVIFQFANFQYLGLSVALSTGAPFRRPLFTNYWFVLTLAVLFFFNLYIMLAPASWFPWLWGVLNVLPFSNWMFKIGLLELALLYIVLSYFIEAYILPSEWVRVILRWVRCKRRPKNRYKHILTSLPPSWPPVTFEPSNRNQ